MTHKAGNRERGTENREHAGATLHVPTFPRFHLRTWACCAAVVGLVAVLVGCNSSGARGKPEGKQAWNAQRAALKYELASTELREGRVDKALSLAREAIALSPEQPGHAELLARVYMARGDFDAAKNVLRAVAASHPDFGPASYLLGTIYEREHRWDRAIEAYSHAAEAAPDNLDYRIALAQAVAQSSTPLVALSLLTEHEEQFAAQPKYHLACAELWREGGHLLEAATAYQRVLMLGYDDPSVRAALGLCLYWAGQTTAAREYLEPLISRTGETETAIMCAYADCLLSRGEWRQAVEWLERFTQQRPDAAQLWLLLARARSSLGDVQGAVLAAARAARLDPQSPEALAMAATTYLVAGHLDAAGQAAQHALQLDPRNLEAWLVYGRVCEHRGDCAKAAEAYRAAWALEPSDFIAELMARVEQ